MTRQISRFICSLSVHTLNVMSSGDWHWSPQSKNASITHTHTHKLIENNIYNSVNIVNIEVIV